MEPYFIRICISQTLSLLPYRIVKKEQLSSHKAVLFHVINYPYKIIFIFTFIFKQFFIHNISIKALLT